MKYQTISLYYLLLKRCNHIVAIAMEIVSCKDIMFLLTWYFIVGYMITQSKIVVSIILVWLVYYRTYSAILNIEVCGKNPLLCPFKLHFLCSTFGFYHLLSYKIEF